MIKETKPQVTEPSASHQKIVIAIILLLIAGGVLVVLWLFDGMSAKPDVVSPSPVTPPAEMQIEVPAPVSYEVDLSQCTGSWYLTEDQGYAAEFPGCAQIKAIYR